MGVSISISFNLKQYPSGKYLRLEILVLLREGQLVTDKENAEISFSSIYSLVSTEHRVSFFRELKLIAFEGSSNRQPVSFKKVNNSAERLYEAKCIRYQMFGHQCLFLLPHLYSQSYPFIYKPRRQSTYTQSQLLNT